MKQYIVIAVTWFCNRFHGTTIYDDPGRQEPEWPPTPWRLFQALLAGGKWGLEWSTGDTNAMQWLEEKKPLIIAPKSFPLNAYTVSVPNNDVDALWRKWAKGKTHEKTADQLKSFKTIHAQLIENNSDLPTIYYAYQCQEHETDMLKSLRRITDCLSAFGRYIDFAYATTKLCSEEEIRLLPGSKWRPINACTEHPMRIPQKGSLEDLITCYDNKPMRSRKYNRIFYLKDTTAPYYPAATFELLALDSRKYYCCNPQQTTAIAGMLRHRLAIVAKQAGWQTDRINTFIHGHTPDGTNPATGNVSRFYYVPIPTIAYYDQKERIGDIRRVAVVGTPDLQKEIQNFIPFLSGQKLVDEKQLDVCVLNHIVNNDDKMIKRYMRSSTKWCTVTPLMLHRHGNKLKAFKELMLHYGLQEDFIKSTKISWHKEGFFAGTFNANQYFVPKHHQISAHPLYHAKFEFPEPINGIRVLGAARYQGMGLLAPI